MVRNEIWQNNEGAYRYAVLRGKGPESDAMKKMH